MVLRQSPQAGMHLLVLCEVQRGHACNRLVVRSQHSHPIASSTFANVGIKGPPANNTFLVEFGFDIRFGDSRLAGSECQIYSTSVSIPPPTLKTLLIVYLKARRLDSAGASRVRLPRRDACGLPRRRRPRGDKGNWFAPR